MLVTHKYKMTRKRLYHTTLRRKCRNYSTQSNDHRRYINSLTTVRRGWVGRPFWCGLVNQFGWYKYSHRVVGPFYSIILCEKYITIVNHQDQQVWLMNPRKPFTDLRFFRVVLFSMIWANKVNFPGQLLSSTCPATVQLSELSRNWNNYSHGRLSSGF